MTHYGVCVLHRSLVPLAFLAGVQVLEEGLADLALCRVHQHPDYFTIHRLPPLLSERAVVVVPCHWSRISVVGTYPPPEVVQEVQLPYVCRARRWFTGHYLHPRTPISRSLLVSLAHGTHRVLPCSVRAARPLTSLTGGVTRTQLSFRWTGVLLHRFSHDLYCGCPF